MWQNISGFGWEKKNSNKRLNPLGSAIRVILEDSFQLLIYHPGIPRALHVIALALIFMLDELREQHLTGYYLSLGHKSAIFQVHLGDFHTTPTVRQHLRYSFFET